MMAEDRPPVLVGRFDRIWDRAEAGVKALLCLCIFLIMALTAIDVFARYVFSTPLRGAYEIVSLLLALSIFLALPLVVRSNEHIVIDILSNALRGGAARVHAIVVRVLEAGVAFFIATRLWDQAVLMSGAGQVTGFLEWPLAPLAYALPVLTGLAGIVATFEAIRAIYVRQVPPTVTESWE